MSDLPPPRRAQPGFLRQESPQALGAPSRPGLRPAPDFPRSDFSSTNEEKRKKERATSANRSRGGPRERRPGREGTPRGSGLGPCLPRAPREDGSGTGVQSALPLTGRGWAPRASDSAISSPEMPQCLRGRRGLRACVRRKASVTPPELGAGGGGGGHSAPVVLCRSHQKGTQWPLEFRGLLFQERDLSRRFSFEKHRFSV